MHVSHFKWQDWNAQMFLLLEIHKPWTSVCSSSFLRSQQEAVEQKAAQSPNGKVTLYRWFKPNFLKPHNCTMIIISSVSLFPFSNYIWSRCGDHVLLSGGPLVARTGLCSQYEVTALHSLGPGPQGLRRRVQGLSLPLQLLVGASSLYWCNSTETMCNHCLLNSWTWLEGID